MAGGWLSVCVCIIYISLSTPVTPSGAYQLPFWDVVGDRPTLDAMKDAVVSMQRRPTLTDKWKTIEVSSRNMKSSNHT